MIDSFEIINKIEGIYRATGLIETIKKYRSKKVFCLIILPIIICSILFFPLLILAITNKYPIIYTIMFYSFAASFLWLYYGNKKYLRTEYGISDKNDEILYYRSFKDNIMKHNFKKDTLTKIKDILEIETAEEKNYLANYYSGSLSWIIMPTIFVVFGEYIKTHIEIPIYVILLVSVLPIIMYIVKMFFDRKQNTKISILKKIKRILIEEF